MYSLLCALRRRKRAIQKTIIFRNFLSNCENLITFFQMIKLMSYSYSNKKIMLLRLKMKKKFFYKSLYNLFQTKLSKLRHYLKDLL